jgi:hypothetical protein
MSKSWTKRSLILAGLLACGRVTDSERVRSSVQISSHLEAESKGVEFLVREVPAWSRDNGCFSCHNNGDAARALYLATQRGYPVPGNVLADTTAWLGQPNRWEQNKGDPGFSDKRLANIQFAAALLAAVTAGHIKDRKPLQEAVWKLVMDQAADGTWPIEQGGTLGSPGTYGTPLATYMALKTLREAKRPETRDAVRKAQHWLRQARPNNVFTAATLLLASANDSHMSARQKREECLKLVSRAQTNDGGWGPHADSPPETFDTAMVLLAVAELRHQHKVDELIRRGRNFLVSQQNVDGSWPATTRPAGGDSYAQRVSTTAWAILALLETSE